jgi:hypothetical protein
MSLRVPAPFCWLDPTANRGLRAIVTAAVVLACYVAAYLAAVLGLVGPFAGQLSLESVHAYLGCAAAFASLGTIVLAWAIFHIIWVAAGGSFRSPSGRSLEQTVTIVSRRQARR